MRRITFSFSISFANSVKHEFSEWDDKNPKVLTCYPSTKITPTSNAPQEVVAEKYVVFSYDVTFQVCIQDTPSVTNGFHCISHVHFISYSPVKLNGHLVGTHIF